MGRGGGLSTDRSRASLDIGFLASGPGPAMLPLSGGTGEAVAPGDTLFREPDWRTLDDRQVCGANCFASSPLGSECICVFE